MHIIVSGEELTVRGGWPRQSLYTFLIVLFPGLFPRPCDHPYCPEVKVQSLFPDHIALLQSHTKKRVALFLRLLNNMYHYYRFCLKFQQRQLKTSNRHFYLKYLS